MASDHEIPYTKVLRPTLQEFSNFEEFVEAFDQDKNLQNYGMLKIVPPTKWKARKENVTSVFSELTVSSPIEQNAQGHSGVYELLLIQKKSMKLNDYRKKVEPFDKIAEGKSVEEIEDLFWKNLAFSPPLYGADIGGTTLFDDGVAWNLNELPGILREGLENPIAGVNNPYLYIGAWKTLFGWHKEDMDLYAVNFNHYGKPKLWYCLPPSENKKLEEFARTQFPESFKKCKEYIRHKTVMMNPYVLKQKIPDLKIHKAVQYPGEFIVTYGGAYHAGFNWGFNIAEAVNFATTRWLKILPNVDSCKCVRDSVKIQYKEFFKVLLEKTKYGQIPSVRKTLAEYGITSKKVDSEMEEEEEEEKEEKSTGTRRQRESLRHRTPSKRSRSNSRGMAIEEEKVEEPVEAPKTRKAKTKIELARIKLKSTKKKEEKESSLLSQSKKIKKIEDDYLVTDWRGLRRGKRGEVEEKPKNERPERNTRKKEAEEHQDVKQLLKTQKLEELVFENWVQCDKCNKWRIIRGKSGPEMDKLLHKKKLECSNIPGRDCSQPEDKQSKDSYILPKNQYVKSVYAM